MALTIPVAEIVESSRNPLLGKHESWGRVLLGDIATIQNGFPFKSSQFTRDEGMPLIRIRDVGADSSDTNYVGDYDPAFIVKAGDLLIGMDGDFNCARWRGPDGLLNQRVCRVILKSDIYHPKLLDYALPGYLGAINDMTSSVTVKHLSSKSIAEIPLPLPPMDQQKRIVAEIEKQFSRLDEAVANLKRVKANLKRYKAAVLKAAVEGRLVETEAERARREGRSYETGAQLLQRILETRRSQWFIPGRGQSKGKYKEPAAPDTTDLPELPEGWPPWPSLFRLTRCWTSDVSWFAGISRSNSITPPNSAFPGWPRLRQWSKSLHRQLMSQTGSKQPRNQDAVTAQVKSCRSSTASMAITSSVPIAMAIPRSKSAAGRRGIRNASARRASSFSVNANSAIQVCSISSIPIDQGSMDPISVQLCPSLAD
ncbi:MAG: restriction endonuclease subunit S [Thiobacillus sp.]|nr:restriction endonuclease subunit S [Thiobacillus sp.]